MIEKKLIEKIIIDFKKNYVEVMMADEVLLFSNYEYNQLLKGKTIEDDYTIYKIEKDGIKKLYLIIEEENWKWKIKNLLQVC